MDAPAPRIVLFCDAASLSLVSVMGASALMQAGGVAPPRAVSWTLLLALPLLAGLAVRTFHAGRLGRGDVVRVLAWWPPALIAAAFVIFVLSSAMFGSFARWVLYAVVAGVEAVALFSAAVCVLSRLRGGTPSTPAALDAIRIAGVLGFVLIAIAWFVPHSAQVSGRVSLIGLSVPLGLAVGSGLAIVLSAGTGVTPRR
ncbi:MAG: hypothetical protein WC971_03475 [Coriobacteriia bacterium]